MHEDQAGDKGKEEETQAHISCDANKNGRVNEIPKFSA